MIADPSTMTADDVARAHPGRPHAPSAPTLATTTPNALRVEWHLPLHGPICEFFELQVAPDSMFGAWTSCSCEIGTEELEYTVRRLNPSSKYVFRIRGGNTDYGWGAWSATSEPLATLKEGQAPTQAFVLVHGENSTPDDLSTIRRFIEAKLGDDAFFIVSRWNTRPVGTVSGGIDFCGSRLALEVNGAAHTVRSLKYISFICHGVGGMFARYALRDLAEKRMFDVLNPIDFVCLGVPHIGYDAPPSGLLQGLAFKRLGETGQQLLLDDNADDTGLPLLVHMVEPDFIAPLQWFRRRVLYADVRESTAPYRSTALRDHHPYNDVNPSFLAPLTQRHYSVVLEKFRPPDETADGIAIEPEEEEIPLDEEEKPAHAGGGDATTAGALALDREEYEVRLLDQLRTLPWSREHVFSRTLLPGRDDMVVKIPIINRGGTSVARHIADNLTSVSSST